MGQSYRPSKSRIPAILFDGNCRHASSHRRRWCLSSIQKQENDWSSHCQFIPVPVQTIETIEIFTGTERDEVEIQVVEKTEKIFETTYQVPGCSVEIASLFRSLHLMTCTCCIITYVVPYYMHAARIHSQPFVVAANLWCDPPFYFDLKFTEESLSQTNHF